MSRNDSSADIQVYFNSSLYFMFNLLSGSMPVVCHNGHTCISSDCLDFSLLKTFLIYKHLPLIDSK